MLCLRCARSALPSTSQTLKSTTTTSRTLVSRQQTTRLFSALSSAPSRPVLRPTARATLSAFPTDTPTSSILPLQQPSQLGLQVRTAIRDTFNPSHRVRKRRHGFLSRLKTRTGRKTIKRRRAKGRNTMSH